MNSVNRKLIYMFRIHNVFELRQVEDILKSRRFAMFDCGKNGTDEWLEFSNYDDFLKKIEESGEHDFTIRLYFNADFKRNQMQKKIASRLPFWVCGNDNCVHENCRWHMYNKANKGNSNIEWLWRCIASDEFALIQKDDQYLY